MAQEETKSPPSKVVMYIMYLMASAIAFLAAQNIRKENQVNKCLIEKGNDKDSIRSYYNGMMIQNLRKSNYEKDSIIKLLQNKK